MEIMPTEKELRSYSYSQLQEAMAQHKTNITTYEGVIAQERERIAWIEQVISLKQKLEDGDDNV